MWASWRRRQARNSLPLLLAGELSPADETALQAALAADPVLEQEHRRLLAARAAVRSLTDEPLPDGFRSSLDAELAFADNPLRESFADLLDRPDDPALAGTRQAVEGHSDLAAELRQARLVRRALQELPPLTLPDGWRAGLDRRLAALPAARTHTRPLWLVQLAWAGTALLVVGCGLLAWRSPLRGGEVAGLPVQVASAPLPAPLSALPLVPLYTAAPVANQPVSAGEPPVGAPEARPPITHVRSVRVAGRVGRSTGTSYQRSLPAYRGELVPAATNTRPAGGRRDSIDVSLASAAHTSAAYSEMPAPAALNRPEQPNMVRLTFGTGANNSRDGEVRRFVDGAGNAPPLLDPAP